MCTQYKRQTQSCLANARGINTQCSKRRHATPQRTQMCDGVTHRTLEEKMQAQQSLQNNFKAPDDDQ
jgi:uncharacterized protein YlaI